MPSRRDVEDQHRVGADAGRGHAAGAIGQVGGDDQLPAVADLHLLQGFRPTGNDPIDREGGRLVALDLELSKTVPFNNLPS